MPLYEYECRKCGRHFEQIQRFSDEPLTRCDDETCIGEVERVLCAPAFQFKGTGWYITDYARKSTGNSEAGGEDVKKSSEKGADKSTSSSTESKSESKSDSKSASKSESKSDSKPSSDKP